MWTILFDHTGHRLQWEWLTSHPGMLKYDWPGWKKRGGTYTLCRYACFACQYDLEMRVNTKYNNEYSIASKACMHCPFGNYTHRNCLNRLYDRWLTATLIYSAYKNSGVTRDMREDTVRDIKNLITKYAARIRDLPLRKDMTIKTK